MKGMWDVRTVAPRVGDGRASARPARVARARAVVALLVCAVCLIASSRMARADIVEFPSFAWDGTDYGFVAPYPYTDEGHNAAVCEMLGYNWYSLSYEVKTILNNGPNDFVTYAYTVRNLQNQAGSDFLLRAIRFLNDSVGSWADVYGSDQIWYYSIDSNARDAAARYVATVIGEHNGSGGGSSGGGGGGGLQQPDSVPEGYQTMPGGTYGNYVFTLTSTGFGGSSGSIQLNVEELKTSVDEFLSEFSTVTAYVYTSGSTGYRYYMIGINDGVIPLQKISNGYLYLYNYSNETKRVRFRNYNNNLTLNNGVLQAPFGGNVEYTNISSGSLRQISSSAIKYSCDGSTYTPDTPDYPNGPAAPTLPDPVDNSTTTNPTYPGPDTNIHITLPSITFPAEENGTDVVPYLKRIISNQQSIASNLKTWFQEVCNTIGDELAEHCNHVVSALETGFGYVADTLADEFMDLQNYIKAVANYVVDSVRAIVGSCESVISGWLKRIYLKMRDYGPSTTAPTITSPTDEHPFDFWTWLLDLVANLIGTVMGGATGAVSTLLNGIKDLFPMSIPWDMMALLAVLDGTRATPVMDITIPAVSGWWSSFTFRIDLTPYDGVASASRYMIMLWWIMVLLQKSTWMIEDVMGAVANRIVGFITRLTRTGAAA